MMFSLRFRLAHPLALATAMATIGCGSGTTSLGSAPTRVAFTAQPSAATAGVPFSRDVAVVVLDGQGKAVTDATTSITLAIKSNTGGGTLSGNATVAAVGGVASFPGLSIDKAGSDYTLNATATGLADATSAPFDVTAGEASRLGFTAQPTTVTAGVTFNAVVAVQDGFGNTVPSATNRITLTMEPNTGAGGLSGDTTVAAVNGVATFADLSINQVGTGYTLIATAEPLGAATSSPFDVRVGVASQLAYASQPTTATAGLAFHSPVTVVVKDAHGNTVTRANTAITVAIEVNPGGGTLLGSTTVAAVNGVATFSGLIVNKAGSGYTLAATATGLARATSVPFDVTAGAASRLTFINPPVTVTAGTVFSPAVTVAVQDTLGNTVPSAVNGITLAITVGTGTPGATLLGTATIEAASGVSAFPDLKVDRSGSGYSLTATASGLTSATSDTFSIDAHALTVGTGARHSCVLEMGGQVYCWGNNEWGTLGDGAGGPYVASLTPVRVSGGLSASSISVGRVHSCLLTKAGEAYCWGDNSAGQLGDGTTTIRMVPVPVLGGLTFTAIAAGSQSTCALAADGALFCWGSAVKSSVPLRAFEGVTFSAVYGGGGTCGLTSTSDAYCVGVSSQDSTTLRSMKWEALSIGTYHNCGIAPSGDAYCWGSNWVGQLGNRSTVDSSSPVAVVGGLKFSSISVSEYSSCGLTTTGDEYCWGTTVLGRLGNGSFGGPDNCGWTWDPPSCSKSPLAVVGGVTFSSISPHGFYAHTCSTTPAGRVYCWGYNAWGQVGDGTGSDKPFPVLVTLPR